MKDRKLELKDIVGYFPYGLKGELSNPEYYPTTIGELLRLETSKDSDGIPFCIIGDYEDRLENFKPLLLPIECLTEEIKDIRNSGIWCDAYDEWWNIQEPDYERMMDNCPRNVLDELYKRMFDVNFLIPAGLAIDKKQ